MGSDFSEILKASDRIGADLVVLGTHRNEARHGMFVGTTAERVIRQGDTPVLVVKDRTRGPYRRAMVGVDFSAYSRRAAEFVLGQFPDAEVVLVHAYDVPFKGFLTGRSVRDEVSKRQQDQFDAMVDDEMQAFMGTLPDARKRLKRVMKEGSVREVIHEQIAKLHADLLVIGTHGRTGVARALLGSVAEDLLNDPPCDVLAVKAW